MITFTACRALALPSRRSARSQRALKAFVAAAHSYISIDREGTLQVVVRLVEESPSAFGFGTIEAGGHKLKMTNDRSTAR
jgi:hypothetical protein